VKELPRERNIPQMALIFYFVFKIIPLLISAMSIYLGYKLFIPGVSGQASLSIKSKDVSGQLLNAAPGLFFAIGGIVAILITVWKGVDLSFTDETPPGREPAVARPAATATGGGGGGGDFGPRGRQWHLMDKRKDDF